MIRLSMFLLALTGLGLASGAGEGPGKAAPPEAGDMAPAFSLPGSDGRTYDLKQYAGRRAVVIAWFPKAFTGG